jgi:hypothetical protein
MQFAVIVIRSIIAQGKGKRITMYARNSGRYAYCTGELIFPGRDTEYLPDIKDTVDF